MFSVAIHISLMKSLYLDDFRLKYSYNSVHLTVNNNISINHVGEHLGIEMGLSYIIWGATSSIWGRGTRTNQIDNWNFRSRSIRDVFLYSAEADFMQGYLRINEES